MQYTFLGHHRLRLWFQTPNICGLFLSWIVVALCVAECWLSRRDATDGGVQGRRRVALWCVRCGLAVSLLGVSLTYSRGSYLALAVSLVVVSGVLHRLRPLFWLALFCLMLVVLPGTATRVASAGDLKEGSVYNRLRLWEGTCAVITEAPLTGAPAEEVGYRYDAWYQPLSLNAHYYYSLNDLLSLASIHGLPLAGTLLALFLCALCVEARHAQKTRNSPEGHCFATVVSTGVLCTLAGCFSTFLTKPLVVIAGYLLPILLLPLLLRYRPETRKGLGTLCAAMALCSLCIMLAIYGVGRLERQGRGYEALPLSLDSLGETLLLTREDATATAVFFQTVPEERSIRLHRSEFSLRAWTPVIRHRLRPALFHHLNATIFHLALGEDWESQMVAFCRQLREKSPEVHDLPLILLGDGKNSPQLLAAASAMPPETDIRLALYAPSEEELQRLLEAAEKSPHTVLIFIDPEIPLPTEKTTIPILPLPNPLGEQGIDSRLKNLERE